MVWADSIDLPAGVSPIIILQGRREFSVQKVQIMSRNLSVLQSATKADVNSFPFPHIVLENALPDDLYEELALSFPSPDALGQDSVQNNVRWNYPSRKVKRNTALPQLWRDFIAYQSSQGFFDEIVELFYDDIHRLYPDHFPTRDSMRRMRAGIRKLDDFNSRDILMDAMISGNTPVTTASSVRSTHIDRGDKLYSGLFYMRPADYDAVGGDLTISRFKDQYPGREQKFALYDGSYVDDRHVDHLRTITYARNTLVLFINSLESLHGVTVRQPSDKSRIFVNLVGEIDPPLYQVQGTRGPARYLPADHQSGRKGGIFKRLKQLLSA